MAPVIRIALLTLAAMTLSVNIFCQPKTAGVSFSYAGTGLTYEHLTSSSTSVMLQIRTDSVTGFGPKITEPCYAMSAVWNMISGELISRNGNVIRFMNGPGLTMGVSNDFMAARGPFAGLAWRFAGECSFSRGIAISISVAPMLGVHLSRVDDYITMGLFRNGLMYGVMPEVGIKYIFGR